MQRVSVRSCQPVGASRTIAWRRRIQRTIATLALACAGACSSTATSGYSEIKTDVRSVIQSASLGPGDEFEVRVYEEPALSGQFVVSATGQVDYPLVGTIASG
jgi:protein involved in polysaccharide export with SLBB domain